MTGILLPRRARPPIRGVPRLLAEFEDIVTAAQVGGFLYSPVSGWRYIGGTAQHKILPSRAGYALHTVGDNTPYYLPIDVPTNILAATWGVVGRIHTPTSFNGAASLQVGDASIIIDANTFFVSTGYFTPTDQAVDRTPLTGAYVTCYSAQESQTAFLLDGAIRYVGSAPAISQGISGVTLGAYNNEAARCWLGELSLTFVLRVGDTAIARTLSDDPWQMFAEEPDRLYFFPSAGTTASVTLTGIASAEAFGTAVVTRSSVAAVTLSGIVSSEAFGSTVVTRQAQEAVSLTGISSAEAFGTAIFARQAVANVSLTGIASAEAFGTTTFVRQAVAAVSLTGIASAEAFGTLVAAGSFPGGVNLTGIPSAEAFGVSTASPRYALALTGIVSEEAFGSPTLTRIRQVEVSLTGIPSAEAFGTLTVAFAAEGSVILQGIATGEAFGSHSVSFRTAVALNGIASEEAFGSHTLVRQNVVGVSLTGIPSGEAFGSAAITRRNEQSIVLSGIASAEAFGSHTVSASNDITVVLTGIPSAEAFGAHAVSGPGTTTLTAQDVLNIADAIWSHPKALTLARYIGLN